MKHITLGLISGNLKTISNQTILQMLPELTNDPEDVSEVYQEAQTSHNIQVLL
jgi:hypothetical protein